MKTYLNPEAENNARNLKEYLKNSSLLYNVTENFSGCTIKVDKKTYSFFEESTPPFIFGLASRIKKEVKEKITDLTILPELNKFLSIEQRAIYSRKSVLTAFQYDLANAYTTFLMSFIEIETFEKLIRLKNNGYNINKVIGMSLLGCKQVNYYKSNIRIDSKIVYNELTPVFKFLYYLTVKAFQIYCTENKPTTICRFVDSVMSIENLLLPSLRADFGECIYKAVRYLDAKCKKYLNKSLFDIFQFNDNEYVLNFHKYNCQSITYLTGKIGGLQFYRNNSPKPIFYSCSYLIDNNKFNALTN